MTAGVAEFIPGAVIPLHTHDCEETVIIIEGNATGHINGESYPLEKYDATIVPANVPHYFSNDSDELTEDEEPFTPDDLEELGLLTPMGDEEER